MAGWYADTVCSVAFGIDATPKVAGVIRDDIGMHLVRMLATTRPSGHLAEIPKDHHESYSKWKLDEKLQIEEHEDVAIRSQSGINCAYLNSLLTTLSPNPLDISYARRIREASLEQEGKCGTESKMISMQQKQRTGSIP
jgi:hypothetical protein